jgi:hypothetical protein
MAGKKTKSRRAGASNGLAELLMASADDLSDEECEERLKRWVEEAPDYSVALVNEALATRRLDEVVAIMVEYERIVRTVHEDGERLWAKGGYSMAAAVQFARAKEILEGPMMKARLHFEQAKTEWVLRKYDVAVHAQEVRERWRRWQQASIAGSSRRRPRAASTRLVEEVFRARSRLRDEGTFCALVDELDQRDWGTVSLENSTIRFDGRWVGEVEVYVDGRDVEVVTASALRQAFRRVRRRK